MTSLTVKTVVATILIAMALGSSKAFAQLPAQPNGAVFSFSWQQSQVTGSPKIFGWFTGSNGSITGFVGDIIIDGGPSAPGNFYNVTNGTYAMSSIVGTNTGGVIGTYSPPNSSGSQVVASALSFTFTAASRSYSFVAQVPQIIGGSLVTLSNLRAGPDDTFGVNQVYKTFATPEIDGAVLPRALFVMFGAAWLVSRLRRA